MQSLSTSIQGRTSVATIAEQLERTKAQYRALLEQAMRDNEPQLKELLERLPKGQNLTVSLQLQAEATGKTN
jgi:hypothetical protein